MDTWGLIATAVLFLPFLLPWGLWLLLAVMGRRRASANDTPPIASTRIDVLIPAHNEELLLPRLLDSLKQQTRPDLLGTVLVVADHCSDSTATLARNAGVSVLERTSGPRGKPAAVREGLAHLNTLAPAAPPSPDATSAVLLLDADCVCSANLVESMAAELAGEHAVCQAAYALESPSGEALQESVGLGMALKNVLRPRGLHRLGLPCQLMGTGMLFRRDVLGRITFEDHLIEDVRMFHTLLDAGIHPQFVPQAQVTSPTPPDRASLTKQRLRWEGGQAHTWTAVTALAWRLLLRGDLRSLVALLDSSAPPLAMAVLMFVLATVGVAVLITLAVLPPTALIFPLLAAFCLMAYLVVGVSAVQGLSGVARMAFHAPGFILWKIALYGRMLAGRGASSWDKTPRTAIGDPAYEVIDTPIDTAADALAAAAPRHPRVTLMGLSIDAITEQQAIDTVTTHAAAGTGGWVITPNLDHLWHFRRYPECRRFYEQASLVLADGMPLIWASRLQGTPLPERVPGSGLITSLSRAAAANDLAVFFLGGNPGAADGCAAMLKARIPQLRVAGTHCPVMGFENDPAAMTAIVNALASAQPHIVFVGISYPRQERLITQLRKAFPNTWFIGVGISFSFVCGEVVRAPRWMQSLGLEWLHRLTQEPRRLFRRYIAHDLPLAARLFTTAAFRRLFPAPEPAPTRG